MKKSNKFFELLVSNDKEKIHEFIITNGKSPKAICPIRFINKDEVKGDDNNG